MGSKTIYCPKCNHSRKVTVDDEKTVSNIQVNYGLHNFFKDTQVSCSNCGALLDIFTRRKK